MQECGPQELVAREEPVQVLDVREAQEWAAGRIEGAMHIPMGQLPARLDELDPSTPVVAVCRSGQRSAQVTSWLGAQGFDACNLRGGVKAWRDAGLALTTPEGRAGQVA